MSKARRHSPPTDLRMGWVDTDVKRDAAELAKGDAVKHLRAYENAWFAVMPFLGGHLWEVQENGTGHSFLPAVVEALAKGVEPAWFQVGNRAHTVAVRDGKPQCLIQNVAQSKLLIDGDKPQLRPRGRMQPVVKKGKGIFAFGAAVFGSGFLVLVASGTGYVALERMVPDARVLDVDNLPYRQWSKVKATADGLYVESLKFQNNQWTTAVKPAIRTSLDDAAPAAGSRPAQAASGVSQAAPAQLPHPPFVPVSVGGAAATATVPSGLPASMGQPRPAAPATPPMQAMVPSAPPSPVPMPGAPIPLQPVVAPKSVPSGPPARDRPATPVVPAVPPSPMASPAPVSVPASAGAPASPVQPVALAPVRAVGTGVTGATPPAPPATAGTLPAPQTPARPPAAVSPAVPVPVTPVQVQAGKADAPSAAAAVPAHPAVPAPAVVPAPRPPGAPVPPTPVSPPSPGQPQPAQTQQPHG